MTTGRGGAGNAVKRDPNKSDKARQAQDVDVFPILRPEAQNRTGRGKKLARDGRLLNRNLSGSTKGVAANVYNPSKEDIEKANLYNEWV